MKIFIFSILRRFYYFINRTYFNYFLNLKSDINTSNKKKDYINYYNYKLEHYQKKYPKYFEDLDLKKFKKISIYTGIDLPDPGDFNFGLFLHYSLKKYFKDKSDDLTILEVGSAKGFSALCFSLALESYKYNSKIVSLDVISSYEKFYQKTFHGNLKVSRQDIMKKIEKSLLNKIIFFQADSLSDLKKTYLNRIHFCFIDGEHDKKFLSNELNFVKKFQKSGDLILIDDCDENLFPEVIETVNKFIKNNSYKFINEDYINPHKINVLMKD